MQKLEAATRETEMKVSADNTMYMVMSRDQNAVRSDSVKIDSSSFEKVEQFKYRVIRNDCLGFNNLPYTIHFR